MHAGQRLLDQLLRQRNLLQSILHRRLRGVHGGVRGPVYLQDWHAMPGRHQLRECGGLFRILCHLPHANAEANGYRLRKRHLFGKHPVRTYLQFGGFMRVGYEGMLSIRLCSRVRLQYILHDERRLREWQFKLLREERYLHCRCEVLASH